MLEDISPVWWTGRQAVVTFPEDIGRFNADRVREQLLLVINRGAVALIADLTATVSCDYSGADALVGAYKRAVASGTELRLVVPAAVVRRVLSLNGLDRLVPVHATLEAAIAAGAERRKTPAAIAPARAERGDLVPAATDPAGRAGELLDRVITSTFHIGVSLQAAADLPHEVIAQRITEALSRLDDMAREVRHHLFAQHDLQAQLDRAWRPPPDARERSAETRNRATLLQQRVVQTAHVLHAAASDTAALLEQRADLLDQPGRIDYPTEIKQWRVLADQAGQLADRWGSGGDPAHGP
jgi:anti-sigma B factor antagonist